MTLYTKIFRMAIWGNLAGTSGATWPVRSWSLCWDGRVFMVNCTINDMIHDQLWLLWCLTSDWSTVRACDVIKGYQTFFANKSLHKNGTAAQMVSFCSARQGASNDMHDDLEITWPWGQATWCNVTWVQPLTLTSQGQHIYLSMRTDERITMVLEVLA